MSNLLESNWRRFVEYYREFPSLGLAIDISRVPFPKDFFTQTAPAMNKAFLEMDRLESGAIANPDERRMVGHYWLRDPQLAPRQEIATEITRTISDIESFAKRVHSGEIKGSQGPFRNVLLVGIGGSALGPQLVSRALTHPARDKMTMHFIDNTDPDGIDLVLARLENQLGQTLCIVVSKSGTTKETENGMKEVMAAYQRASLPFEQHAVAVTMPGSKLHKLARPELPGLKPWLGVFPMWEWVGGRT
ncbi:MAG: glucose-6-phosphate isomerase, partial [Verrucomicrobiae bacterium]|nr:glucose-6-phosphate isomerase [Verrucomicrobiae bacterium]